MKFKHLFLAIISCMLSFSALSQDFRAGAQLGIITSQISGDASGGFYKMGLTGGLFVSRDLRGAYSGEFGIIYTPKGSKRVIKDKEGKIIAQEYELSLSYIEIPILMQYATDSLGLKLEIGPAIGVLLGQKEWENIDVDYGDFNRLEWGIMAGISKQVGDNFSFGIRASHSVLNVRKHPSGATWRLNRGQYNNALMANIKYHFN